AASYGLTSARVFALAASGTNLFAGTFEGGVFRWTSFTWRQFNDGLTNGTVHALTVGGTSLFAGTEHGGAWRRPLPSHAGFASATMPR
ncbi:MAG: hypothetical protein ACRENJ_05805, partial [Candidatus Eiseniibacteriota bacterium]